MSTNSQGGTASLKGFVKDQETGLGIEKVRVLACTAPCGENDWKAGAYSGSDGSYTLGGLDNGGDYHVQFLTWPVPQYISEWYNDKSDFASSDPVTATDAGTDLSDTFLDGNTVTITGAVTNSKGKPIAGVTVYAKKGEDWVSFASTTGTLDGGKNYTLSGLSAGSDYHIYFYGENLRPVRYDNEWYDDQPDDGSLTVPAGATGVSGGDWS
ncbi:MAG: carboxypeptidase regulatory-like domain-containing protein [Candidatus Electrothrix sp. AUS4]|nr:carboxypeptidase regulatory-like domain-containing protein [Candidatus Electrothrix sp. AUS4]